VSLDQRGQLVVQDDNNANTKLKSNFVSDQNSGSLPKADYEIAQQHQGTAKSKTVEKYMKD
tara:strand:- start:325 stop:507 length:183 start_codon:yes stop_codon:yes gene_type:complete